MYSSHQLDQRSPAPRRRSRRGIWVLGVLGLMAPSCLIDSDDRCGPNQELYEYAEESERCICVAGTAFNTTTRSCVACGENEMATPAGCLCAAGYVRVTPADPCTEIPAGQMKPTGEDQPCATHDDCAGLEASFCDSFVSGTCLVPNCTLAPQDSCFTGKECCDLSTFQLPTLCIAAGACTT